MCAKMGRIAEIEQQLNESPTTTTPMAPTASKLFAANDSKASVASSETSSLNGSTSASSKHNTQKPSYKHVPHSQKPPHLVAKRNARERRRVQAVNQAFYKLRKCVPIENRNKRVSKVKTLQRAIDYIRKLERILADDSGSSVLVSGSAAAAAAQQLNEEAKPLVAAAGSEQAAAAAAFHYAPAGVQGFAAEPQTGSDPNQVRAKRAPEPMRQQSAPSELPLAHHTFYAPPATLIGSPAASTNSSSGSSGLPMGPQQRQVFCAGNSELPQVSSSADQNADCCARRLDYLAAADNPFNASPAHWWPNHGADWASAGHHPSHTDHNGHYLAPPAAAASNFHEESAYNAYHNQFYTNYHHNTSPPTTIATSSTSLPPASDQLGHYQSARPIAAPVARSAASTTNQPATTSTLCDL